MTRAERIFSVTVFPIVLGGSIAIGLYLMEAEIPPAESIGLLVLSAGLVVFCLERLFPHHQSWLHSKGDLRPDLAYLLGVGTPVSLLVAPIATVLGLSALGWLSERFGADLWPTGWPILAQLPLALVVWRTPTLEELALLFVTAVLATSGHYTLNRAFQAAELTALQPFSFLQLVWATLLGLLMFGERPDFWIWAGAGLIVISATWIARREVSESRAQRNP